MSTTRRHKSPAVKKIQHLRRAMKKIASKKNGGSKKIKNNQFVKLERKLEQIHKEQRLEVSDE